MTYTISTDDLSVVKLNEAEHVAAVIQEVAVVLSTRRGSIPLYRDFGLPMRFLDMPINVAVPIMIAEVTEAIQEFVPYAELIRVVPIYDEINPARMRPSVEVRIIHEQES
jgi:hypothetical protein